MGSLLAGFDGTALLVTHNRDEAYRLCPEMVVLDSGRVLRSGHTRDVFADPRSITAARLTGCKNILPCTLGCAAAAGASGAGRLHRRGHPRPRLCALRRRGTERLTGSSPFFQ